MFWSKFRWSFLYCLPDTLKWSSPSKLKAWLSIHAAACTAFSSGLGFIRVGVFFVLVPLAFKLFFTILSCFNNNTSLLNKLQSKIVREDRLKGIPSEQLILGCHDWLNSYSARISGWKPKRNPLNVKWEPIFDKRQRSQTGLNSSIWNSPAGQPYPHDRIQYYHMRLFLS